MSTRSCIARTAGEGKFIGTYHHWDGYPEALGATLYELYNGHFNKNLETMLAVLIDQHPAGWSSINNADFNKPIGFGADGPKCYCHGERSEAGHQVDQDADMGMEWAYVFDVEKRVMYVLERVYKSTGGHMVGMFGMGAEGNQRWADAAIVELDKPAPNWGNIHAEKEQSA